MKRDVILSLLRRTKNNLQQAVEIYFTENEAETEFDEGSDDEGDVSGGGSNAAVTTSTVDTEGATAKTTLLSTSRAAETPPLAPPAALRIVMPTTSAPKPCQMPCQSSAVLPRTPSVLTSIESRQLTPLSPPASKDRPATEDAKSSVAVLEEESIYGPGTYEVVTSSSNLCWQIGSVFGRAVVQQVQPGGPAAVAGIQKSDVLLAFRDTVLNEENCAAVVQHLSNEVCPLSLLVLCAALKLIGFDVYFFSSACLLLLRFVSAVLQILMYRSRLFQKAMV